MILTLLATVLALAAGLGLHRCRARAQRPAAPFAAAPLVLAMAAGLSLCALSLITRLS